MVQQALKAFRNSFARLFTCTAPGPEVLLQLLRDDPGLAPRGELGGGLGERV